MKKEGLAVLGLAGAGGLVLLMLKKKSGVCAYADSDGVVRIEGLVRAIDDYFDYRIDYALMMQVQEAYNTGVPC